MQNAAFRRTTLAVLLVVVAIRIAAAALAPVVQDEAYYLEWSKALDFGYFDHPPAVAWLGAASRWFEGSAFAGRAGGLLAACLTVPFCAALLRRAGVTDSRAFLAALVVSTFNLCGLTCGILVVPDTLMFVAWCAALSEAAAALDGDRKRWLTCGVATGLGLLSKYVMVLILPVLLIGALARRARELRSPWPWAGLAVALLVFSPHLVWNARNDWTPIRFQLLRGFTGAHTTAIERVNDLPAPHAPGTAEIELARRFGYEPPVASTTSEPRKRVNALESAGGFVGSLLAMWGGLLALLASFVVQRLRRKEPSEPSLRPHLRPLLYASVLVPTVFFGLVSLRTRVEANWPAVYVVGASAFLASFSAQHLRALVIGSAINVALLLALCVHARMPLRVDADDRVLDETRGYRELAEAIAAVEGPVFVDRHQTTGMLRFYLPQREITQWPGLTRPSEFVRRPEWNALTRADLAARGSFWLVLAGEVPPSIEGSRATRMLQFTVCAHAGRIHTHRIDAQGAERSPHDRRDAIHRWHLVGYEALATATK